MAELTTGLPSDVPQAEHLGRKRHIPALDGLRGAAVLLVMVVHLGGGRRSPSQFIRVIAYTLRAGWVGVVLFFVLSGFLITGILWDSLDHPGWWRRFYMRRSLRIFPLYYLSLAYALLVGLVFARVMLPAIPFYALYLQDIPWFNDILNLVPEKRISLGSFWSLAVEEQFYLLWPLALYLLRKNRKAAMALCTGGIVASLLFRLIALKFQWDPSWCYRSLPGRAEDLLLGAWIALAVRGTLMEQRRLLRVLPASMCLSALAIAVMVFWTGGSLETTEPVWLGPGLLAIGILMASILVYCLQPNWIERLFRSQVLRWFGAISYGLYVFQGLLTPAFKLATKGWMPFHSPALAELGQSIIAFAGATLLAWLSFNTFERYFLRMKERLHN